MKFPGPASYANSLHSADRESGPVLNGDLMIASHPDESADAYRSRIHRTVPAVLTVAVASGDL